MARLPYLKPYDPEFLGDGFRVQLPTHSCQGCLVQSGRVYDYIHFSLVMHKDRRMALYTAHNIDTSQRRSVSRTGWDLDPRLEPNNQTGGGAYKNNPWDRGHLVRRAAIAWGPGSEAKDASDSSFYYTNAAPQHEAFNQDDWLDLEDWVLKSAGNISPRLCVFTGPIYTQHDEFNEETRIPAAFFKVVVLRDPTADGNDLSTVGFLMKQNKTWDPTIENFRPYQVGIAEIGRYTGIDFGDIALYDEFEWRQPRFRDRSRMNPIPVDRGQAFQFSGQNRRSQGIRAIPIGSANSLEATILRTKDDSCGCSEDKQATDERIAGLIKQVNALSEMVEILLEKTAQDGQDNDLAIRAAREFHTRIVGGVITSANEFPECACIGNRGNGQSEWFCSGVLVHPRVVLTAAHCAPSIDQVYLGGRSINLIGIPGLGEVKKVQRIIVHPDYHPHRIPSHDIAILVLEEDATTQPVEIALEQEVNVEDNLMLVGFGYDHPTEAVGFGTKRKVDVPLTNLEGMDEALITQVENQHGFENNFEFHAGRKELGKDSCNGDSGGPAYIRMDGDVFKLAGLTSRAAFSADVRCGDGGIYTRVAPYLEWIYQVTEGRVGLEPGVEPKGRTPNRAIYISAAQPNAVGPEAGNEWVEIKNASQNDVSLNSYSITDKAAQGQHELGGLISAGSTKRVVLPENSKVKLNNNGDEIILKKGGELIHKVSYTNAGAGEIIQFEPPQGDEGDGNGGNPNDGCGGNPNDPPLLEADPC